MRSGRRPSGSRSEAAAPAKTTTPTRTTLGSASADADAAPTRSTRRSTRRRTRTMLRLMTRRRRRRRRTTTTATTPKTLSRRGHRLLRRLRHRRRPGGPPRGPSPRLLLPKLGPPASWKRQPCQSRKQQLWKKRRSIHPAMPRCSLRRGLLQSLGTLLRKWRLQNLMLKRLPRPMICRPSPMLARGRRTQACLMPPGRVRRL
mmetsp:Transcript_75495/g.212658  ORF Transcript_75495/g.212658 Transcript_75495/m.212658 type:complete len:202 (+) Transcript_75495:553-1158(+)